MRAADTAHAEHEVHIIITIIVAILVADEEVGNVLEEKGGQIPARALVTPEPLRKS